MSGSATAPDLYAVLGAQPTYTPAAIRRAYRRASKDAHPDHGGDPHRWTLVCLARDVLTDAGRRRVYDETGRIEEKPVDNTLADALQQVAAHLDQVFAAAERRGQPLNTVDVITGLVNSMQGEIAETARQDREIARVVNVLRGITGRFRPRAGQIEQMAALLTAKITALEEITARNAARRRTLENAIVIVQAHEFDFEKTPLQSAAAHKGILPAGWGR